MKRLVKSLFYMVIVILLIVCDYYDPIDPNPTPNVVCQYDQVDIPDDNFLNALIKRGIDVNGDSIITYNETLGVSFLNISEENISDFTGIEAFHYLTTLYCDRNPSKYLTVNSFPYLKKLSCQEIKLSNGFLFLDENPELIVLRCDGCNLVDLCLSSCGKLTNLTCGYNCLSILDLSANKKLKYIAINDMPSLNKVCVWKIPFPLVGPAIDTTNSPNLYFTMDCDSSQTVF